MFCCYLPVRHYNKTTKITDSFSTVGFHSEHVGSFIWQASLALAMNSSRPLLQPPRILAQKLQNMCHEQGACVEFCVTSIHAKRRRTERERGRERERDQRGERQRGRRQEQGRLGHLPAGQTLLVLPKFKFLTSLLLLPSFTACWRRSAGLTWLPDAFSLAVKLRTWVIVFRDSFLEVIIGIV